MESEWRKEGGRGEEKKERKEGKRKRMKKREFIETYESFRVCKEDSEYRREDCEEFDVGVFLFGVERREFGNSREL